jgi:hypothetical protein
MPGNVFSAFPGIVFPVYGGVPATTGSNGQSLSVVPAIGEKK